MIICKHCKQHCCKRVFQKNGAQKYQCVGCKRYSQTAYRYKGSESYISASIINLNNEDMGIRGIARFLKISNTTVIKRIRLLSETVKFPPYTEYKQEYEMDELWTYCGSKQNELYVSYAINRHSKQVIDFIVGGRTKENLEKPVNTILSFNPVKIYTDKLNVYPSLISEKLHKAGKRFTNHIERFNLTLRTHIKRLVRSTIGFSKKPDMLVACLKLYFGKKQFNMFTVENNS